MKTVSQIRRETLSGWVALIRVVLNVLGMFSAGALASFALWKGHWPEAATWLLLLIFLTKGLE